MTPSRLSIVCARAISWAWRFRTLQRAQRLFAGCEAGELISRRYAGNEITLEPARSDAHRMILLVGEQYVEERHALRGLVAEGDHVVEVGANVGYVSLLFVQMIGSSGKLTCFEPDCANYAELQRNIKANCLHNVRLHDWAVGAANGRTSFTAGLNGRVEAHGGGDVEVEIRRLDDCLAEPINVLKIDVEGHEQSVLDGATAILERYRPRLFVEVHPQILGPVATRSVLGFLLAYDQHSRLLLPRLQPSLLTKVACRYFAFSALESHRLSDHAELDHSGHASVWVASSPPR